MTILSNLKARRGICFNINLEIKKIQYIVKNMALSCLDTDLNRHVPILKFVREIKTKNLTKHTIKLVC